MKRIHMKRFLCLSAVGFLAIAGCGGQSSYDSARIQAKKNTKKLSAADLQQYVSTNAAIASVDKGHSLVSSEKEFEDSPDGDKAKKVKESTAESVVSSDKNAKKDTANGETQTTIIKTTSTVKSPFVIVPPRAVVDTFASHAKNESSSRAGSIKISNIQSTAPCATKTEAQFDALKVAVAKIESQLLQLEPPINCSISTSRAWNEFVVKSSVKEIPLTEDEKLEFKSTEDKERIRYAFDVEIKSDQIRSLRSEERLRKIAMVIFPGIIGIGALGYLFRSRK